MPYALPTEPIYCFGEVLWDVFPSKQIPGGAPMNVAIGLSRFDKKTRMISSVGKDDLGNKLLSFLSEQNVQSQHISVCKEYPTGVVKVQADKSGHNRYDIVQSVAWDYIPYKAIQEPYTLVYGSLVARMETSKKSLLQYIRKAACRIFDVNFRQTFYHQDIFEALIQNAQIVKMNDEELDIVSRWYHKDTTTTTTTQNMEGQMRFLMQRFGIEVLLVTKGAKGAIVLYGGEFFYHKGYSVQVKDTVGSGDGFLSGFLSSYMEGVGMEQCLSFACAVGAFIATHQGANPLFTKQDIHHFVHTLPTHT